nr:aminoglycoside phosphotransferase [Actinomycetota bacterium]
EPARPVAERTMPASPVKDVTGMLRSFHYASRFAIREHGGVERRDVEQQDLGMRARAWEDHNRQAFTDGYRSIEGVGALLPVDGEVVAAYELDKALYELDYERAYRPDWVDIPMEAIIRILAEVNQPPDAEPGLEGEDSPR